MALLYNNRYLFTGDHLWWDRESRTLQAPSVYVWRDEDMHWSTQRLLDLRFEWVLPGHGDRIRLPGPEMKATLHRLLKRWSDTAYRRA